MISHSSNTGERPQKRSRATKILTTSSRHLVKISSLKKVRRATFIFLLIFYKKSFSVCKLPPSTLKCIQTAFSDFLGPMSAQLTGMSTFQWSLNLCGTINTVSKNAKTYFFKHYIKRAKMVPTFYKYSHAIPKWTRSCLMCFSRSGAPYALLCGCVNFCTLRPGKRTCQ